MIYIKNVETLEELKKVYKKLALQYHPDCGGTDEEMAQINNEYDEFFNQVKNTHKNKEGKFYEKETQETVNEWKKIIEKLLALKMKNVLIEVIGSFLWVSGETKPYKEDLKELGLKWGENKKSWYLSPKGYKRFGKKKYEMNEIRQMYDNTKIQDDEQKRLKLDIRG